MRAIWKGVAYEVAEGPRWRTAGGDWERIPLEVEERIWKALQAGAVEVRL